MKKKTGYMMALAFVAAFTVHAQLPGTFNYKVAEISLTSFQRLVVNADINVVLLQNDTLKKAFIEGNEKLISGIKIFIAKGVMTISSEKDMSYKGRLQVTVAVNNLSQLEVNSDAFIASVNPLKSSKLSVVINGDCTVQLVSARKISFTGIGGHNVEYVQTEKKVNRTVEYYQNLWN
jgi:Putative auto-transporter adhesin, head GIN domain